MKGRPLPMLGLLALAAGLTLNLFDILPALMQFALTCWSAYRAAVVLTSHDWHDMTALERTITLLEPLA